MLARERTGGRLSGDVVDLSFAIADSVSLEVLELLRVHCGVGVPEREKQDRERPRARMVRG